MRTGVLLILGLAFARPGYAQRGRDTALASWRARGPTDPKRPTDLWVRVYGDAAVLAGVVGGTDTTAPRARITKPFVRQPGRWLLAALHGSAITER